MLLKPGQILHKGRFYGWNHWKLYLPTWRISSVWNRSYLFEVVPGTWEGADLCIKCNNFKWEWTTKYITGQGNLSTINTIFLKWSFFLGSKLQSLYIISIQEQNRLIWVMYIFNEWIFGYVIKLFTCFYSEDYLRVFGRHVYSLWTPIKEVRNDIQWTSDWLTYSKTCRYAAKF